jgi:hypothetical protein
MGMCGLTTVNELELLVGFAQKFSPDLVIVQYLINDALPSGPGLMRVGEEWLSSSKRKNIFSDAKLHEKAKSASYLYAFLNDRFLTLQRKLSKTMTWKDLYADDSPGFLMQKRALSEFGRWMQKSGVKIMFVLFPSFPKGRYTADNFPNADIYIKVKHLAEQHGLLTLNLIPVYTEKGDDFSRWFVSPSNGHPNEEASRIAADAMNRFIEENKLIPHQ